LRFNPLSVKYRYQTRLQAKKALSKNGKIIGDNMNLMVCVVAKDHQLISCNQVGVVDCNDKAWLQAGESSNKRSGGLGFPRTLHPPIQRQFPRLRRRSNTFFHASNSQLSRTYKVDIFDTQRPPVAQNSMWGKFVDYIIGS